MLFGAKVKFYVLRLVDWLLLAILLYSSGSQKKIGHELIYFLFSVADVKVCFYLFKSKGQVVF
jgi:hypothetical protein